MRAPAGKTILIVDDTPDEIAILEEILKDRYRVKVATNGEAALKLARGDPPPDLILLDVVMPGIDGYEVCRRLRQDREGAAIPVIFLTVRDRVADETTGFEVGAVDYIAKPVDPQIVKTRIAVHLELREELLRVSEVRYRRLFETAAIGILIVDAETGMIVDANQFLVALLGFRHEAILGKRVWELGYLKDIARNRAALEELHGHERLRREELPLQTADGRRIHVELVGSTYLADHRTMIQWSIRDITERKRAEEERGTALRRQEGVNLLQKSLLSPAPLDGKLKSITDGIVQIFDVDFCRIWLIRPGDLCERGCMHAEAQEGPHACRHRDRCLHLLASSGRYTHTDGAGHRRVPFDAYKIGRVASGALNGFVTNDVQNDPRVHDREWARELGLVSFAGYPLRVPGGDTLGVLAVFARQPIEPALNATIDGVGATAALVIQQALAQEALRDSEARYRTLFEASADGILIADAERAAIGRANPALCRLLGYSEEELTAMGVTDIHPMDAVPRVLAALEALVPGQMAIASDIPCLRKDKSLVYADISGVRTTIGGAPCIVGFFRDISERKRAESERQTLEAEFRQAQKMEAVGRLAGGVAHDFNNMLQVISSYTELALASQQLSDPLRAHIQQIAKAAQRSADLTRQLLAFARKQVIAPKILDLDDAVAEMLPMLHRLIGEDIDLTWSPAGDRWLVEIDPSQVGQVLVNLTVNARDAITGVGRITIESGHAELDRAYCLVHRGFIPGQYAVLSVRDDGSGMDEETLARAFEPFFTTKPTGQGTGLGLATVYGIVKQNGGFVNVYSEPGKGTTVRIYLPRRGPAASAVEEAPASEQSPTGTETVLLVEDEAALLELGTILLVDLGYTVLSAGDPREAIRLAREHAGEIDLLLTDVVMPGMDGRELWQRLTEIRPGLKCLFMSGYSAGAITDRGILGHGIHFIQKPFSVSGLATKLREALLSPTTGQVEPTS